MFIYRVAKEIKRKISSKLRILLRRKKVNKEGVNYICFISKEIEKEGGKAFIDFGTLLGITRNNSIIAWDDDLDFGIHISNEFSWDDLERCMLKLGFRKNHQFWLKGDITEQNYSFDNIYVDFFRHYEDGDYSFSYVYDRRNGITYPSTDHWEVMEHKTPCICKLKEISNGENKYFIPCNTEEYLASVYGEDWREPNSRWTHHDSPAVTVLEDEYAIIENFV